jgi:hypothetical protein
MVEPNKPNGTAPPQPDDKFIDGKFVDLIVHEDYIIHCGRKYYRKDWQDKGDAAEWKRQWEFIKRKLAARGPLATANMHGNPLDDFKKLIEWSNER